MAASIYANNDRRSYISAATRGGVSFDRLCRGEDPYYVADKECLVHVTHQDTLEAAEKKLVSKIGELFNDLQIQRDARVTKFYVGKTYIQSTKKGKGRVDPMDPDTWRKQGISQRWSTHQDEDYGRDGMMVIAVITRSQVPLISSELNEPVTNQEQYTLALEQRLLHHYKITQKDTRLDNNTFSCGGNDKKGSAGYALYVAFRLEENEEEKEEEVPFEEFNDTSLHQGKETPIQNQCLSPPARGFDDMNNGSPLHQQQTMTNDWLNNCQQQKLQCSPPTHEYPAAAMEIQKLTDTDQIVNDHGTSADVADKTANASSTTTHHDHSADHEQSSTRQDSCQDQPLLTTSSSTVLEHQSTGNQRNVHVPSPQGIPQSNSDHEASERGHNDSIETASLSTDDDVIFVGYSTQETTSVQVENEKRTPCRKRKQSAHDVRHNTSSGNYETEGQRTPTGESVHVVKRKKPLSLKRKTKKLVETIRNSKGEIIAQRTTVLTRRSPRSKNVSPRSGNTHTGNEAGGENVQQYLHAIQRSPLTPKTKKLSLSRSKKSSKKTSPSPSSSAKKRLF